MKKLMVLSFVAVMAIGFTSCKKCTTCSYELSGQTVTSGEQCGDKSDIEAFEESWKAGATLVGATNVQCD